VPRKSADAICWGGRGARALWLFRKSPLLRANPHAERSGLYKSAASISKLANISNPIVISCIAKGISARLANRGGDIERWFTMPISIHRLKISTTVALETHEYLADLVRCGRATSMAEALDQTVLRARRADSKELLAHATAAYFQALSGPANERE
jgi:hypothetical protein